MIPIVSTLDRGEFMVKLRAFSSQREDYEEIPIKVDVSYDYKCLNFVVVVASYDTNRSFNFR